MFRQIVKGPLTWLLRAEAKLVLKKYRPKIVAITGSVGKTGTKEAVAALWRAHFRTRASVKSFNHELGIPLTILNLPNAWWNPIGWLKNLVEGLGLILFWSDYPEWLVLEVGVERPGDIKRLVKWLACDIVVITHLPAVPVHVEYFPSPAAVTKEKLTLLQALRPEGVAILNHDDSPDVTLKNKIISHGFNAGANLRGGYVERLPEGGLSFKVDYLGSSVPVRVPHLVGQHQLYGVLAALAAGISRGINLLAAGEVLVNLAPPPGRLRLLAGIKGAQILDDTYNASPAATRAALRTLADIPVAGGGRRIGVLGDMLELGPHTILAHQEIGKLAAEICDELITVGPRSKFIGEAAIKAKGKLSAKNWKHCAEARSAGAALARMLVPGDLALVKGSQGVRLERTVATVLARPQDAPHLLCRQDPEWLKRV